MHNAALAICTAVLLLSACSATQPYIAPAERSGEALSPPPPEARTYQVFLIGDAGEPTGEESAALLKLLGAQLAAAGEQSAVVFLGDNIYPSGLPDSAAADRAEAEQRLLAQLQTTAGFEGRVVMLAGNHDWNFRGDDGLASVRREEAFVEAHLARGNTFLPDGGFPGPVEVKLRDDLRLVVLDTGWWFHKGTKPFGDTGDYDLEAPEDFLVQLNDVVQRNRNRDLLVVGHHPVFSNGAHAGYFPLRVHLFPLTAKLRWAYVPLPVLGSLYPLFVQYVGGGQNFASLPYRQLRQAFQRTFAQHEDLIYVAGHEHGLQYFKDGAQHYIVSGGGSKKDYVAPGRGAAFAAASRGFSVLDYYRDGQVWMAFWTPDEDGGTGRVLFHTRLRGPRQEQPEMFVTAEPVPDYQDSTVAIAAGARYGAGPVRRLLFGEENRKAWTTPAEAPVLDLGREAGGLVPVQRGGGQQTLTLRLKGGDGHEYVLRSVDKDPSKTVPVNLQGTLADDIVQDQIASLFPYSPLIAAPLAEAGGIYHTNPRIVFVPDDPRLGIYREAAGGQLMLFEIRPDGDLSDVPGMGGSDDVVGAPKLYRELTSDNDHRVDQRAFVRARLLDLLISDWDRGPDQWRWATFDDPDGKGKLYRPIPRDRDFAFNRLNGFFPAVAPYIMRRYESFNYRYGSLVRLTTNGLGQDRRFTNALTRQDWVEIADSLRAALTDDVIAAAVANLPGPIYAVYGPETIARLKARRDALGREAERFYLLNARVTDIVGSDKHERFEVTHRSDTAVEVVVYKTTKEGEVRGELYRRTFVREETEEIRLYGLDGQDQFIFTGAPDHAIRVIVVGGPGEDRYADSRKPGSGRKSRFYDAQAVRAAPPGSPALRPAGAALNFYGDHLYTRDLVRPQLFFGSNQDDGLFVGGGVKIIRHGFDKTPYAQYHRLVGNVAARTGGFNIEYAGRYVAMLRGWDALLDAQVRSPNNIRNYYGLGNETANTVRDAAFYQARIAQVRVAPGIAKSFERGAELRLGPVAEYTQVDEAPGSSVPPEVFADHLLVGLVGAFGVSDVDDALNPKQGFRWVGEAGYHGSLHGAPYRFGTLHSALSFYASPLRAPQVTVALRLGGGHNFGDFPFYRAETLGGKHNLRGYRSTRYAGRSSLYQNMELRVKAFNFASAVAVGQAGVLGFFDNGRVWADGETSRRWHQGYGGGLWTSLFNTVVVTGTFDASGEERAFTVRFGFLF